MTFLLAAFAAAAVLGVLFVGWRLKRRILAAIPIDLEFQRADPSSYPGLDVATLGRYTQEFEALGFVHVGDHSLSASDAPMQPGIARLLVHPDNGCYVEVNQLFPANRPAVPMRCAIATAFDEGWSLSTTDREPQAMFYALRRPRSLWTAQPGLSTEALLAHHSELRARLERELHLRPVLKTSESAYFARQREEARVRKRTIEGRNIFVFLTEILRNSSDPPKEWLGQARGVRGT